MTQKSTPRKRRPQKWRKAFLSALARTGCVLYAARAAKADRTAVYRLRESDIEFARAWEQALEAATDLLEAEAVRRAVTGVKKPVYQGGERVGFVQEYSDTLLIFLLKGAKPEKYRERFDVRGSALPDAEQAIAAAAERARARRALPPVEILPAETEKPEEP